MHLTEAVRYLDDLLRTREVGDFPQAMNGLQVENSGSLTRVGAAVDATGLGARGAIGAGRVTGWAPGGAWRDASALAEPSRNSSDSFGISFAPIPRRSRQFRLSASEPLVEF